jgi:sulfur carrier protein ThiS
MGERRPVMTTELLERERTVAVKVVMMGKNVTTYVREEPLHLGDLLNEVGVNGNMEVRVNGASVEKTHRLATGDMVMIVPKIRGG